MQAAGGLAKTAECLRDLKSALVGKELELTATWHEQVEACAQGSGSAAMLLTLWKQFQVQAHITGACSCPSVAQPSEWRHCCPACQRHAAQLLPLLEPSRPGSGRTLTLPVCTFMQAQVQGWLRACDGEQQAPPRQVQRMVKRSLQAMEGCLREGDLPWQAIDQVCSGPALTTVLGPGVLLS